MKRAIPVGRRDIVRTLRKHQDALKRYRVRRIGLFGSYASGKARKDSDIDLLVEFEEPTFDRFMDLTSYLEKLFGKKVDILTPEGVRGVRVKSVAQSIRERLLYV